MKLSIKTKSKNSTLILEKETSLRNSSPFNPLSSEIQCSGTIANLLRKLKQRDHTSLLSSMNKIGLMEKASKLKKIVEYASVGSRTERAKAKGATCGRAVPYLKVFFLTTHSKG